MADKMLEMVKADTLTSPPPTNKQKTKQNLMNVLSASHLKVLVAIVLSLKRGAVNRAAECRAAQGKGIRMKEV